MHTDFNCQTDARVLLAHADGDVRNALAEQLRQSGYTVITNSDPVELNRIVSYVSSGLLSFDLCIWDQKLISSELLAATEQQQFINAFPFLILFLQTTRSSRELRRRLQPAAVLYKSLETCEQLAVIENVLPAERTS